MLYALQAFLLRNNLNLGFFVIRYELAIELVRPGACIRFNLRLFNFDLASLIWKGETERLAQHLMYFLFVIKLACKSDGVQLHVLQIYYMFFISICNSPYY
jgi:hypothetical protein